jgi:ATP-dependent Clp protease protease subunit
MAQFVLCGGAAGRRAAQPHARILMHQPHGAVQGVATDIAIQAEHFGHMRQTMAERLAVHTGQPVDRVIADMDRDNWFTAAQAFDYGMVDEIVDGPIKL